MTEYEMRKIAKMQSEFLVAALKEDEELADIIFPSKYLNIEQAAEFINSTVGTIYHKLDEIPHIKNGKRLSFSERALVRYMERQKTNGVVVTIDPVREGKPLRRVM